jgi:hypothetical protein
MLHNTINRDLLEVLGGEVATHRNSLVFSNGKTALLLPSPSVLGNGNGNAASSAAPGNATNSSTSISNLAVPHISNKGNRTFCAGNTITTKHICEHFDCNKALFSK